MKLLVFGKSGQVAHALQDANASGFDMTFLSRTDADLSNPDACASAVKAARPDMVMNAAAYTDVDGAETNEALAHVINGEAPGKMAGAAAKLDIPFMHISTDYIFDGSGYMPHAPDANPAPMNAYGRSKLAGEIAVRAANPRHVILRTSWVFSPYGSNFVKTMLRLSETRTALNVVRDQIGGPTPARAIATTLLTIATALKNGASGGTYHVTGAPALSWADFARAIFESAGKEISITDIDTANYPTPAQRPLNSRLDCATLMADFGITQPEWKPALAEMIRGLRT